MPSFHFDAGDSTNGPLGLCARVTAETAEEALQLLQECLPDEMELDLLPHKDRGCGEIEYVNVYINPDAITVGDIDEEDEEPPEPWHTKLSAGGHDYLVYGPDGKDIALVYGADRETAAKIGAVPLLVAALREASAALTELDPLANNHNARIVDEALRSIEAEQ